MAINDRMTLHGPAPKVLTYGRQCLDEDDKKAVLEVLNGEWLTQGPVVERFETALCDQFGTKHAVVCANGTAALHLAALCLDWKPGDVVIVPAITFLASANCCLYVGAEPYFVDIDNSTFTIDPNEVERHVKQLRAAGRRVRAVVGVDLAGHSCDWPALRAIADRYDLMLLDDACHAMGGEYGKGTKVGSCVDNDMTTLSFHPVKHITTGEGGAVLTNDPAVAERARRLRNHGTVRGEDKIAGWEGPWHSDMVELGFNFRLTDFQCALGLSQLRKLERFVERRRAVAAWYDTTLNEIPRFRRPEPASSVRHAYHLYIVRAPFGQAMISRRELFARCLARDLRLQVHYRPVVLNSYYRKRAENSGAASRLPISMRYYQEAVSLPMYTQLTQDDVAQVITTIRQSLDGSR